MDTQNTTTETTPDRGAIGPYRLRGLTYARSGPGEDFWRATLACGNRRIAKLQSETRHGPVAVDFLAPRDRLCAIGYAATWKYGRDGCADEAAIDVAVQEFLLALAEGAYHLRQLQVQARRHTLFRLVGDPEDSFRTLHNAPYSAGREGQLRLVYGQRLIEVVRSEPPSPGRVVSIAA